MRIKMLLAICLTVILAATLVACGTNAPAAQDDPFLVGTMPDYVFETTEPDSPMASEDYDVYLSTLHFLLDGSTWDSPADISHDRLVMWAVTHAQITGAIDLNRYLEQREFEENAAKFFVIPRGTLEPLVGNFFGTDVSDLRGSSHYSEDFDAYLVDPNSIPNIDINLRLTRVDQVIVTDENGSPLDDIIGRRALHFTATHMQQSVEYIVMLTVDMDGRFQYDSLVGAYGETTREAVFGWGLGLLPGAETSISNIGADVEAEDDEDGAE